MSENIILIFFFLLLLIGAPLVFIPMFPAIGYMCLVAFIFGLANSFSVLSLTEFLILLAFLPISIFIDQGAGILGAKYGGASRKAIIWGVVGTILGFLFPVPFGALAGLFVGVFLAEVSENFNYIKAFKAGAGGVAGMLTGMVLNFVLALLFFALFVVFVLWV